MSGRCPPNAVRYRRGGESAQEWRTFPRPRENLDPQPAGHVHHHRRGRMRRQLSEAHRHPSPTVLSHQRDWPGRDVGAEKCRGTVRPACGTCAALLPKLHAGTVWVNAYRVVAQPEEIVRETVALVKTGGRVLPGTIPECRWATSRLKQCARRIVSAWINSPTGYPADPVPQRLLRKPATVPAWRSGCPVVDTM